MRFARLRLPSSLTTQLLAISVGALLLMLAVIGVGTAFVLSMPAASFVREDLSNHARRMEEGMAFDAENRLVALRLPERLVQMYDGLPKDMAFRVADAQGRVLFSSPPGPALDAIQAEALDGRQRYGSVSFGHVTLQILTTEVQSHGNTYMVQVARSERMASLMLVSGSKIVLVAGMVTTVLSVLFFCLLVLWTSRRAVRPLREASAVAAGIDPRNLAARLDARPMPSELTPLIDAFNSALERLEKGYRVQQEFLASAAHELKTPLALIRAEVEIGHSPGKEHLLKGVDVMARQVHQLLHLAEVSEARNFMFENFDAATVMAEAASFLGRVADDRQVLVDCRAPPEPVPVHADRGAFFILVKNLVENAIQHTPPGGCVTVQVDAAGLAVRNPGPTIAAEEMPRLFARFWRGAGSTHAGAGLGLAICNEIAMAHGWRLIANNLDDPPGAEFRVDFSPSGEAPLPKS